MYCFIIGQELLIKMKLVPLFFLFFLGLAWTTDRPIIGILTQETDKTNPKNGSYIAASYVKMVEQSGARVVPIFINRTEEYYRKLLPALNGVVFPGGGSWFNVVGGYGDAGRIIVNYTKEVHLAGDHFPVLGICLGFELLLYLEAEDYGILGYCNSTNIALPLKFKSKFQNSQLYYHAPKNIINMLKSLPITYNYHVRCTTEEQLKQYHLTHDWQVLSTSTDIDGKEFISSIESRHYPTAAVQFHPEKNAFEWNSTFNIPHSEEAVYSARYFYDWLVNEARKNNHTFKNTTAERESVIYNYNPTYVNKGKGYFEQVYYFKNNTQ